MRLSPIDPAVRRTVARAAATLVAWGLIGRFVAGVTWMTSDSMASALRSGGFWSDVVVVDRLTPRLRPPERGECVYFNIEDSEWAIKRVVGLPGEKLAIAGGQLVANGEPVKLPVAPEVKYLARGHLKAGAAVRMAPGHFLVLGDYSADSWDGHFWGGLKADRIEGFGRARIWPPSRLGWL